MIVSAFCRSAIFLFQLSLHDFFHYELLNLAGDGGGELGDKCDVFGNFKVRDLALAELAHPGLVQTLASV